MHSAVVLPLASHSPFSASHPSGPQRLGSFCSSPCSPAVCCLSVVLPFCSKVHDEREHMNIVFIGHVDAGKSTISGQVRTRKQAPLAGVARART